MSADKSHGDVVWILGLKGICDQIVPGFKEKSAAGYAEWRRSKIDIIRDIERDPNFRVPLAEKKTMTPQEQAEFESFCIDDLLEHLRAPDPRLSTPEKTWATFIDALRNADRKLAVSCLTSNARKNFRGLILEALPDEKIKALANAFKDFQVTMDLGEIREAAVVRHDGRAGIIHFQRVDNEWKISEM